MTYRTPILTHQSALSRLRRGLQLIAHLALVGSLTGSVGCIGNPDGSERVNAVDPPVVAEVFDASRHFDRPPLYRVSGGAGADLIMLGTIHLGPQKGWALSPEAMRALREASALILELDPRLMNDEAVGTLVANMVMLDPPETLESVIRPETAKLLEEMNSTVAAMGLPRGVRRHMKPWFVAAGLIESATAASGYPSDQSVEGLLTTELNDRPLIALETFESQLRLFDTLPLEIQDVMLYDTLLRLDETAEGIEELVLAWRTADEAALGDIARQGVEELPRLELFYTRLLDDRNRDWRTKLIPLLDDEKRSDETILVGVGALHLVGSESVLSLLRELGYAVSSIPQTRLKPGSSLKRAHD